MILKRTGILILTASVLLTGCEASDDESTTTTTDTTNTDTTTTDTTTTDTTTGTTTISALTYSGPVAAVTIDSLATANALAGYAAAQAATEEFNFIASSVPLALLDGVSTTAQIPCETGNITITADVADATQHTPEDSYLMTFNDCLFDSELSHGSVGITLNGTDYGDVTYTFSNLKRTNFKTADDDYDFISGGFSATRAGDVYNDPATSLYTGTSLILEKQVEGVVSQALVTDFSASIVIDGTDMSVGFVYTYDHDFTIASAAAGGEITVETVVEPYGPLSLTNHDDHLTSGQLIVTGADNAKVRMTAQADGTYVFLEYDIAPADGAYEDNASPLWTDL